MRTVIHVPSVNLHPKVVYWPFQAWAMDLIGAINPPSSKGHVWILVAIDYFTKWVEAIPLRKASAVAIAPFIRENPLCRFGIPISFWGLITDNGTQFTSQIVADLLEKYQKTAQFFYSLQPSPEWTSGSHEQDPSPNRRVER